MDELVKSVSIDTMLNQRQAVDDLLQRARPLLVEAETLADAAPLGSIRDVFSPRRHHAYDINILDDDGHRQPCTFSMGLRGSIS